MTCSPQSRQPYPDLRGIGRLTLVQSFRCVRLGASRWTNVMLQPPSLELLELVVEMSHNQPLCNQFTNNFNYPERQWDRLASSQCIRAWIDEHRAVAPTAAVA